ncbi:hypothetical protein DL546_007569 [Coniochaeta pulveracea]|uniref:Uncharacterized protein n=1 Tax=Coniochaeta pulveracea TaxID=177199 RepID=A0A420YJG4_9PEZI|nr:hypothetical protein DL546_007569 [Coniochaeta pulveracea]
MLPWSSQNAAFTFLSPPDRWASVATGTGDKLAICGGVDYGGGLTSVVHSFNHKLQLHTLSFYPPKTNPITVKMRFAAAAVILAGAAMAQESTVYSTAYYTVTSCAATVTNCPAHSTVVSTVTYPIVQQTTPAEEVTPTGSFVSETAQETAPASSFPTFAVTSAAAACPTYSVKTISTSVTTVVPTVIYETVAIPCPTTAAPSSGFSTPYNNGTKPTATPSPPIVTAGASTIGSSLLVAAAAGFAALVLA